MRKILFIGFVLSSLLSQAQTIPQKQVVGLTSSLADKARKTQFNILDYGAVGDNSTNNTTAIQAAMDAAAAVNGVMYIPEGIFKTNTITWAPDVKIIGASSKGSVLKAYSAVPIIQYLSASVHGNDHIPGGIYDLTLDGASTGTIGIEITGLFQAEFVRLFIKDFTTVSVKMLGCVVDKFRSCTFSGAPTLIYANSTTLGGGVGFTPCNLINFDDCVFLYGSNWAVDWNNSAGVLFNGCDFEVNGTENDLTTGVIKASDFSSSSEGLGLRINGGWAERNNGTGILINPSDGHVQHVIRDFLLQYATGTTNTGLKLVQTGSFVQKVFVSGCKFDGHDNDVITDGANAYVTVIASDILVHSEANSGTYATYETNGGAWTVYDANTLLFTGPSNHSSANVNSPSGYASYFQAYGGDGVATRIQSGPTKGSVGTFTNFPFNIVANGTERVLFPAAGGTQFVELAGNGDGIVAINNNGEIGWSPTPTGSNWSVNGSEIYRVSNVGFGSDATDPSQLIDVFKNQTSPTVISIKNTTSAAGSAVALNLTSSATFAQFGVYSATTTAYGQIAASSAFHYTDGAKYVQAIDNASGKYVVAIGSGVATETFSVSTTGVYIANSSGPSTPTGGAYIYAASGEMGVKDASGNSTTISPHNFSGIPGGKSEEMAWAFYSERDGKYINVDMLKLARLVEKLTGEKLVYIGEKK